VPVYPISHDTGGGVQAVLLQLWLHLSLMLPLPCTREICFFTWHLAVWWTFCARVHVLMKTQK